MSVSIPTRRTWLFLAGTIAAALMFNLTGANAANIAPSGTGTIGYAVNPLLNGTENDHAPSTTGAQPVNDNNTSTHVDDYPYSTNDYVGVTFATPQNNVGSVGLIMAMFQDGGWFGASGTGPGGGNSLPAADLIAPSVQVTTDGINWTTVGTTNNYVSAMTGAPIGNNGSENNSPLSTFTLDSVENDVLGIRLIGNGGGTAGNGGFIGVSELYVNTVPEPSTLAALFGLAGIGLILFVCRHRRNP